VHWILLGGGAALLWLSLLHAPRVVTPDLDPSWQAVLAFAFREHLAWGKAIIFTFGPWGWLECQFFPPGDARGWLFGICIYRLALTIAIVRELSRLSNWSASANLLLLIAILPIFGDSLSLLATYVILKRQVSGCHIAVWDLVLLALIAQTKLIYLFLALGGLALCIPSDLLRQDVRRALLRPTIFIACFAAWWIFAWQSGQELLAYLLGGLQIVVGYSSGMQVPPAGRVLFAGLLLIGVHGLWCLSNVATSRRVSGVLQSVLGAGTLFIAWKHGFSRADGHTVGFFASSALIASFWCSQESDAKFRSAYMLVVSIVAATQLAGLIATAARGLPDRLFQGASIVLSTLGSDQLDLQQDQASLGNLDLNCSTDVIGYQQGALLRTAARYCPRPIAQSYSAYTQRLLELNARHFADDAAPDQVLVKIQTIDDRAPAQDDSLALLEIRNRYEFREWIDGFALFVRSKKASPPATRFGPVAYDQQLEFGKWFELSNTSGDAYWIEIEFDSSWIAALRKLLYQPIPIRLFAEMNDGTVRVVRLVPEMAVAGFLLSPWIDSAEDFVAYCAGEARQRPVRIRLEAGTYPNVFFDHAPHVIIRRTGELGLRPGSAKGLLSKQFSEFAPISYTAAFPPEEFRIEDGRLGVMLHADSEVVIPIPDEAKAVGGYFGLRNGSYSGLSPTDGAKFEVVVKAGSVSALLMARQLSPTVTSADRRPNEFQCSLPAMPGRLLLLKISSGPTPTSDWTYWGGIKFEGSEDD
jgi:hypothetical protein